MKQAALLWAALTLLLGLTACGGSPSDSTEDSSFSVRIICEAPDLCQIFYTYYVDGLSRGSGGVADLNGSALTAESDLTLPFPQSRFEQGDDIALFSIDFSPYGRDDTAELATTQPIRIAAQYGQHYTVVLSGDREQGFQAVLQGQPPA